MENILVFLTTVFLVVGGCGSKSSSNNSGSSSSSSSGSASNSRSSPSRSCVPLPSCAPLVQLAKNKDKIPGMSRSAVMKTLKDAMCGFEGNTPKVFCNVEEEAADDDDNQTFLEKSVQRNAGGAIDHNTGGNDCEGVLRLHHLSPESGDVGTLMLRKKQYSVLKSLNNRTVYNSQVDGGCCWQINAQPRFIGRSEKLGLGKTGSPEVQPRAAMKISCSEVNNL